MIAFMAICSVGAQEVYIGGGFTVGSEDSEFVFQISPEVGCHLTDQWAVGGEIGYTHYDDYNRFQFAPQITAFPARTSSTAQSSSARSQTPRRSIPAVGRR